MAPNFIEKIGVWNSPILQNLHQAKADATTIKPRKANTTRAYQKKTRNKTKPFYFHLNMTGELKASVKHYIFLSRAMSTFTDSPRTRSPSTTMSQHFFCYLPQMVSDQLQQASHLSFPQDFSIVEKP
jgi:hypothetical protein